MVNQKTDLLAAFHEASFLQVIYDRLLNERGESRDLTAELVSLHNDGQIDLIAGFRALQNEPSSRHKFFLTRHVLEKALPHLNAPIQPVMDCVLHLVNEGGKDMAAGTLFAPFIEYCAAEPSRPKESLKQIEASVDELADLLVPTIVAGARVDPEYYLNEATRMAGHENIEIRRRAVFSLGRIVFAQGSNLFEPALACLERSSSEETDDQLRGSIIKSAFSLYKQHKSNLERSLKLLESTLSQGGDYVLHAASELFCFEFDELPEPLLALLLDHLERVNPQNKGTITKIDYGLVKLFEREDANKGMEFLENLLLAHPNDLSLDVFDSVIQELLKKPHGALNRLLTRWFLRGDRVLCEGIHAIVTQAHGQDMPLAVDPSELDSSDQVRIVFLARKVIGYLFSKPVTAASIIISLIHRTAENETVQQLGLLLFDPLLMNYPGKVNDYLRQAEESETERVRAAVAVALKAFDDYLNDLRSTGEIPELHPSQSERDAHARYFSQLTSESMRTAANESVFLSLVSKSVLLYGRKSINYASGPDGESNRMEIPLKSHSAEIEFPRYEHLDAFGLDYMLRIFRAEQINREAYH